MLLVEENDFVSIIMPNYNGQQYIARTIESVLAQTFENFEFIIIDDGSNDDSWGIIQKFNDKRIRAEKMPSNEHICYALNYGLKKARGNYIARIDSDDLWEPDKLAKQVCFLEKNPEYGACFTWVTVIDENNRVLSRDESDRVDLFHVSNKTQAEWVHHFFFNGSCLCHPSVVIPRSVIEKVGDFDYALVQIQDFDMWVRIAKEFPIHVIEEPLTQYRWASNGGSVSSPTSTTNNRSNYEFYNVISKYFDGMSDEMFLKAFGEDLIHKDSFTHDEILCEQALLLLRPLFCGYAQKSGGMDRLKNLINNETTRDILREKYGITQKNFYELSASPVFYQHVPDSTVNDFTTILICKTLVKRLLEPFPWILKGLKSIKRILN